MQHLTEAASNYIPFQSTFNAPLDVNWLNEHSMRFGFSRLQCGRDQCELNADLMRIQCPVRTGLKCVDVVSYIQRVPIKKGQYVGATLVIDEM